MFDKLKKYAETYIDLAQKLTGTDDPADAVEAAGAAFAKYMKEAAAVIRKLESGAVFATAGPTLEDVEGVFVEAHAGHPGLVGLGAGLNIANILALIQAGQAVLDLIRKLRERNAA